jgi:hypothetical protein
MSNGDGVSVEHMPPGSLPVLQELLDEYVTEAVVQLTRGAHRSVHLR